MYMKYFLVYMLIGFDIFCKIYDIIYMKKKLIDLWMKFCVIFFFFWFCEILVDL